jgi:hypothetical protein
MESDSIQANQLAERVATILDSNLRIAYIRHLLQQMDVVQLADLITIAKANAETRNPLHSNLLLYILLALSDESCEQLKHAVSTLLHSRDRQDLSKMLLQSSADTDRQSFRVPDFGLGRQVTLGERKAFARRSERQTIAQALRDPHASVIRILLDNPALTESDVVRLCARRPILPEIVREVFRSWRWIVRYDVKTAIILNPNTPLDISLQLVPQLKSQDLRRVITTPNLPQELYESCQRSLSRTPIR